MSKATMLKVINPILLLLFINQASTGLFHHSLSHKMFEVLHEGGGIVLIIVSLLHLILNWGWVRSTFLKRA
ncbi:MAG TPA: hypothetical protein PLT82_07505 [Candidatus Hydrogenedens sp.]|nr:hypothetical protein [Candidatus Hydrogenedens sp.]HOK09423.1 hypothetical protein [Candidatus Hydrogenedens sp.]HOL18986.1 hypothetical protein [Candidatus Hydrogenedens sp.]HPP58962.1 hypothetical protein [Candidatus Hydrogenedens sp.]